MLEGLEDVVKVKYEAILHPPIPTTNESLHNGTESTENRDPNFVTHHP